LTFVAATDVQVAYMTFGEAVVTPTSDTKEAINRTVEQVKHGEMPTISLQPGTFFGVPRCPSLTLSSPTPQTIQHY
jgi:hypothetical protein